MIRLTIDGRTVSAEPHQTILEVARATGITDIPALCWYPKLPTVGNCRICLVSVEGQAKLVPACATTVAEGMIVRTESRAAVENRKGVLRLLLERYPGDHLINGGRAQPRNEFEQRSEEHTSELQSPVPLVCRLLLEKKHTHTSHLLHLNKKNTNKKHEA